MDETTRTALNTCLAKAIAYANCGKPHMAKDWAERLVGILKDEGLVE